MFYDIYAKLCSERAVTPTRAAIEMGINKGTVSYWKNKGGSPNRDILMKVSEYFGVSLDYLSGAKKTRDIPHVTAQVSADEAPPEVIKEPKDSFAAPSLWSNPPLSNGVEYEETESIVEAEKEDISEHQEDLFFSLLELETEPKAEMHERIYKLRRLNNMSIDELARACGVERQTIKLWESGKTQGMRRYKLARLAKALSTTADYLLNGEGEAERTPLETADYLKALKLRSECRELLELAVNSSRVEVEMTLSFLKSYRGKPE